MKTRFNPFHCGLTYLALVLLFSPLISYGVRKLTYGFTVYAATERIPTSEQLLFFDSTFEPSMLDQPFYLYAKGAQCYAFISEDGNYILKFLKGHHYKRQLWTYYIPSRFVPKRAKRCDTRCIRDLKSYEITAHHLAKQSGILAMQIGCNHPLPRVFVYDCNGIDHAFDLKKSDFNLQKKAQLPFAYLSLLKKKRDDIKAKEVLSSLFALYVECAKMGIHNEDLRFYRNAGIMDGQAMFIDVGRFCYLQESQNPSFQYQNLMRESHFLRTWLKNNYSELIPHLDALLESYKNASP